MNNDKKQLDLQMIRVHTNPICMKIKDFISLYKINFFNDVKFQRGMAIPKKIHGGGVIMDGEPFIINDDFVFIFPWEDIYRISEQILLNYRRRVSEGIQERIIQ